jgi:hypothetical protein
MKKTKKQLFASEVFSAKALSDEAILTIGQPLYEVQVVRKFKAKSDDDGALIIPEAK